jgi:hypothetical protein
MTTRRHIVGSLAPGCCKGPAAPNIVAILGTTWAFPTSAPTARRSRPRI